MGSVAPSRILLVRASGAWGSKAEPALCSTLESAGGREVVSTTNGEEAVALAVDRPFDLAVADLVLPKPGISGAYTLTRIRELCPDCRTIVISDHDYVASLLGEVADAFLVRSPHPRSSALGLQIASLVQELLAGRRQGDIHHPVAVGSQISTIVDSTPAPTPSKDSRRGLIAGKYRLASKLGEGGMGEVYRAEDTFIQRPVAIKLMRMQSSARKAEQLRRRMHREVMIAGRLMHPNIVTLHDAGFNGMDLYLVMALVDGPTLHQYLKRMGRLHTDEALAITLQILDALGYAHDKGIVHRDLKPSNVLMGSDGTAKVADFGLAKIRSMKMLEDEAPPSEMLRDLTDAGAVLGTVGYMAPEQMLSIPSDSRSDLFSLAAILFEMLHGRPLARIWSAGRLVTCSRLGSELPPLPELEDSPELDDILRRALALEPDERFQSCAELAAELQALRR